MKNLILIAMLFVPTIAMAATVEMVSIPPGTFTMGIPPDEVGRDNDEQQHEVTLSQGFLLGRNEITQRQWQAIMGSDPAKTRGAEHPVEQVSWYECVRFCNALSAQDNLPPAYEIVGDTVTWNRAANGYRLPTEAEWEYACRAYSSGPHAGDLDEMAIYSHNSGRKTRAVGGRQPNAWGLHDMHGNVWEWVWDQYLGDYTAADVTDPASPTGDGYRVERGGS